MEKSKMNIYKINYTTKNTKSNNTYVEINSTDEYVLLKSILSINSYMQELCLSKDKDVLELINWYRTSNKSYPYNKRLERRNTPESMLGGLINNLVFGKQQNLSLEQLEYYEDIINTTVEAINILKTKKQIDLQSLPQMTKITFGIDI